jgi:hypothetical protein
MKQIGLVAMMWIMWVAAAPAQLNDIERTKMIEGGIGAELIVPAGATVQLAILLDTSNSMDGLIDQARARLWKIVNEFIFAKKEGRRPQLRVALYEYGNDGLPGSEGFIRQVSKLTDDLDKISEELFALRTSGGAEFCGQVIQQATRELGWSSSPGDLKLIFIAGNEPFTQGEVDFREACGAAVARGVTINTIHCGNYEQGISGRWKDGALLADGSYMNIDQNREVVHIEAPQDAEIGRLGALLNDTYIPYGTQAEMFATNQIVQDSNALDLTNGAMVQRSVTKASSLYNNANWDLVDALEREQVDLEKVEVKDLPEPMREMTLDQRKEYVAIQQREREGIQAKIVKLNEARVKFVAEEMKKRAAAGGEETLDEAILKSVRLQAAKKNFKFE